MSLENRDLVALKGQEIRTGEARGARTDDRHLAAVGRGAGRRGEFAVVRHPLRGKGLEVADVDGLVQVGPHAGGLTGVRADQAADPGEGVVLPHHFPGLLVLAGGDEGQEAGDVDARRTGQVAGGRQEFGADQGVAVLVQDVVLEFFPEVMERGENGVYRLPAEVAGPGALQALAGFLQFLDGLHGAGAAGDAGQKIMNLGEGLEAPRAMAAGLLQDKSDLVADPGHQAVPLVQGLNHAHGQAPPQLPDGLVSEGEIDHGDGEDAPHRSPHLNGLGFAAVAEPAADLVDDIGQGGGQGQFRKTGALHRPQEAEGLGAGGALEALLPEPGHRLLGDERQGGDGDQAVDQESGAGVFLPERVRQFALEWSGAGDACPPA